MRKAFAAAVLILGLSIFGGFFGARLAAPPPVHAQSTNPAVLTVLGTHTSCGGVSLAGQTIICGAGDGLWLSINGAAFAQVQTGTTTAGVTSLAVNGGTPQTGAVSLTIPSKATTVSTTTLQ